MNRKIELGRAADVPSGEMKRYDVAGVGAVTVYCVGGQFYATQDECTHGVASLCDEGVLDGHVIECTWHGGKFDVRTGQFLTPPCSEPLKTYSVVVDGDTLSIAVDG